MPKDASEKLDEETVSKLSDSLKSCHKVVEDYRAVLLDKAGAGKERPKPD